MKYVLKDSIFGGENSPSYPLIAVHRVAAAGGGDQPGPLRVPGDHRQGPGATLQHLRHPDTVMGIRICIMGPLLYPDPEGKK